MAKPDPVDYYREEKRKFEVLRGETEAQIDPIREKLGGRDWFNLHPRSMRVILEYKDPPYTNPIKFPEGDFREGTIVAAKLMSCHDTFHQLDLYYRSSALTKEQKEEVGGPPEP
jgi:hypothetical protein